MKTKLEQICDEVAKENGFSTFKGRGIYSQSDLWPEVCKRYAIEVAKLRLRRRVNEVSIATSSSSTTHVM